MDDCECQVIDTDITSSERNGLHQGDFPKESDVWSIWESVEKV